jgi:hypothetical protein
MFEVKGLPILVDELEVLKELKRQVYQQQGREILRKMKVSGDNIMVCCPIHNDGQERKPSCGISLRRIKDKPPGTVHCFACGYTNSLEVMISECFGYQGSGFGTNWLLENFINAEAYERPDLILDFSREIKPIKKVEYIKEEELQKYRFYHPYMYKRKLTNEIIDLFDVGYNKDTNSITFPVKDINGNVLFVTERSVITKHFHIPEGVDKPLYGIYECMQAKADEIYICESQINALTCWVYGKHAIALFGTGNKLQYEILNKLPIRKVILALDPDKAGDKGTYKLKKYLRGKIITKVIVPQGKDINDLNYEEFISLKEIFI